MPPMRTIFGSYGAIWLNVVLSAVHAETTKPRKPPEPTMGRNMTGDEMDLRGVLRTAG